MCCEPFHIIAVFVIFFIILELKLYKICIMWMFNIYET